MGLGSGLDLCASTCESTTTWLSSASLRPCIQVSSSGSGAWLGLGLGLGLGVRVGVRVGVGVGVRVRVRVSSSGSGRLSIEVVAELGAQVRLAQWHEDLRVGVRAGVGVGVRLGGEGLGEGCD
jgi:hypothetical protein